MHYSVGIGVLGCFLFVMAMFDMRTGLTDWVQARSKPRTTSPPASSSPLPLVSSSPLASPSSPPTSSPSPPTQEEKVAYRLGDGLKFYPYTPGCKEFPDSIVCAYQTRTREANSLPDLLKVLDARNQTHPGPVPDPQVAVIHVRLGDGLCTEVDSRCNRISSGPSDCWNDAHDCFAALDAPNPRYAYPKEYYFKVVEELKKNNVQRLVIMTNMKHWTNPSVTRMNGTAADERYLSQLRSFLQPRGFNVTVRLDADPDEDFTYACAARMFVQGGGGFSKLIARVVQARGGVVLPTQIDEGIINNGR